MVRKSCSEKKYSSSRLLQVHKEVKDVLSRRSNLGGSRLDAAHVDIVLPEIPAIAKCKVSAMFCGEIKVSFG
jgi:hypothetical protein